MINPSTIFSITLPSVLVERLGGGIVYLRNIDDPMAQYSVKQGKILEGEGDD